MTSSCGIDLEQVEKDPFGFQYDYHHYEPEVYSMGAYFEGFNLRQLKRIMFIFNETANSYMQYLHFLRNKKVKNIEIGYLESETLEMFKTMYDKVKRIVEFINKFQKTDKFGVVISKQVFGPFYEKQMHGRCWVKEDEELEKIKYIRFATEEGRRWGYGPTEEYMLDDEKHIKGSIKNLGVVFVFGHWLTYFKIALTEDKLSTDELNNFNPNIIDTLINDYKSVMENLKKI